MLAGCAHGIQKMFNLLLCPGGVGKEFKLIKSCKAHFGNDVQLQICYIFYDVISNMNLCDLCFVF